MKRGGGISRRRSGGGEQRGRGIGGKKRPRTHILGHPEECKDPAVDSNDNSTEEEGDFHISEGLRSTLSPICSEEEG